VTAVWVRFRVELRSRWRSWLAVAVLAGLAGGVLVGVVAGARRTDSALTRYLVAYHFRDASVLGNNFVLEQVRHLPQVAASSIVANISFSAAHSPSGVWRSLPQIGPHAVAMFASTDGQEGVALDQWKVLAGRRPHENRVHEAVFDSRAARTFGVAPGNTVDFNFRGTHRAVPLRVVGVVASTEPVDFPVGVVYLTRAFYRAHMAAAFEYYVHVRLARGAADLPAFRRGVRQILPGDAFLPDDQRYHTGEIQSSIHPLVQALSLGVAVGALLSFFVLAQSLTRLSASASPQYPTLRALGMTGRQLVGLGIARAATIAVTASALAVGTSVALSPLAPVGYARELEPHPGLAVDPLAVGMGAVAVLVAVLLAGSFAAWQGSRGAAGLAEGAGRVRAADALARSGMPAPITTGVRLALARGRSSTVRTSSAVVASTVAVAVVGTALTFSASLHHLFVTPRLFGQNWDFRADGVDSPPSWLMRDPSISAIALGNDKNLVEVDGRQVGVRAMEVAKGSLPPTVIEGRAPTKPDQILLGTKTMRALGVHIGDWVEVSSYYRARMLVVGRGVLPTGNYLHNELGEGAAMTWAAYASLSTSAPSVLELRIRPGADRARTLAELGWEFGEPVPGLPATAADFGGVNQLPALIAASLVAFAVAALAQTLVMLVRRRRRDLAVLKTLGFDRRQVLSTVAWQATTFAAIGLLIGLPVGDALGRWLWNLFADQLGVFPEAVTPIPLLLLIVPGTILFANLVAIVPARVAAKTQPALVLRAE
jgi:putative ABC transport system permease protein